LMPKDFNSFKSYYFGRQRSQINKDLAEGKEIPPPKWGIPSAENEQKAKDILDWWKEKEFDPTIDINEREGLKDNNLISIALHGQITSKYFDKIVEIVNGYERANREKLRAEEEAKRAEETRAREEEDRLRRDNADRLNAFNPQQVIEEPAVQEPLAPEPRTEGLQRLSEVNQGEEFTSNLSFKKSVPWASGAGMNHVFEDEDGNKYLIFDRYQRDPATRALIREPSFDFAPNQDYIIKGVKGEYSTRYRTTGINKPEVINQEVAPEVPEVPEVEAPIAESIEREPIENTILGNDEEEKKLEKVSKIGDYAKRVVETGRTRDITDDWGNVVTPGREMPIEELIPIYVNQLTNVFPDKIESEQWIEVLNQSYAQGGNQAIIRQINLIPKLLRNAI